MSLPLAALRARDPRALATFIGGGAIGGLVVVGGRGIAPALLGSPMSVAIAIALTAAAIIIGMQLLVRVSPRRSLLIGSATAASATALLLAVRPIDPIGPLGWAPLLSALLIGGALLLGPLIAAAVGLGALVQGGDRIDLQRILAGVLVGALGIATVGERLFDIDRLRLLLTVAAITPSLLLLRDARPVVDRGVEDERLPTTELQIVEIALSGLLLALGSLIAVHMATVSAALPIITVVPIIAVVAGVHAASSGRLGESRARSLLPAAAAAILLPLPAAIAWPLASELLLVGVGLFVLAAETTHRLLALPVPGRGRGPRLLSGAAIGALGAPALVVVFGERFAPAAVLGALLIARTFAPGLARLDGESRGEIRGALTRIAPFAVLSSLALMGAGAILAAVPTIARFWPLSLASVAAARSPRLLVIATLLPFVVATAVTPAPSSELRGVLGSAAAYGDRLTPISWVANGPALVGVQRHDGSTGRDSAGAYDRSAPIGSIVALVDAQLTNAPAQRMIAIGIAGGDAASYARAERGIDFIEPLPELAAIITAGRATSYLIDAPGEEGLIVGAPRRVAAQQTTVYDLVPTENPDGTRVPSTWIAIAATPERLAPLAGGTAPFRPAIPAARPWYDRQIDGLSAVRLFP